MTRKKIVKLAMAVFSAFVLIVVSRVILLCYYSISPRIYLNVTNETDNSFTNVAISTQMGDTLVSIPALLPRTSVEQAGIIRETGEIYIRYTVNGTQEINRVYGGTYLTVDSYGTIEFYLSDNGVQVYDDTQILAIAKLFQPWGGMFDRIRLDRISI